MSICVNMYFVICINSSVLCIFVNYAQNSKSNFKRTHLVNFGPCFQASTFSVVMVLWQHWKLGFLLIFPFTFSKISTYPSHRIFKTWFNSLLSDSYFYCPSRLHFLPVKPWQEPISYYHMQTCYTIVHLIPGPFQYNCQITSFSYLKFSIGSAFLFE